MKDSLNIHFKAFPISFSVESDSIFSANTQSKISVAEHTFPSEIAITQTSDTASATSKRYRGYREPSDAALISQGFVNQTSAARRASSKSFSPTNGHVMFLDEVEIDIIRFFSVENDIFCFTISRLLSLNVGERFN